MYHTSRVTRKNRTENLKMSAELSIAVIDKFIILQTACAADPISYRL